MKIVGCDLHTRYQQIAMLDQETGELFERRLEHESGEARAFYAALSSPVRVGVEATGHTRWFEQMAGGPGNRADLTPEGAPSKLRLGGVLLSRKNTYLSPTLFPAPPSSQFGNRSAIPPLSS
jgi:hypothetical protein